MKKRTTMIAVTAILVAIPVLAAIHYFQGFEIDTFDWSGVTRVASGTDGITSAAGAFHADVATGGASTHFGE